MKKFFEEGRNLFYSKQTNVISAATIIMVMVMASRILGLVRNRVYVHFFPPEQLDTFLAAFQLPDIIFEILIMGAMSSAFIPVFTRYLNQKNKKEAWYVSAITLNILLAFFAILSILIYFFAYPIYSFTARGFTPQQISEVVYFTRYFLIAQMFFAASYLLTAILETHQRFIITSVAPLFYNFGIIGATVLLAPSLGLYAPVVGVVAGAIMHFLIQVPLALKLGFRPAFSLNFRDPGVRAIGRLAIPRLVELSFLQVKRFTDLYIASIVAGGITYFRFGDSLTTLPTALFGLSIAKASLPRLSQLSAPEKIEEFRATFASSFKEILFLVVPASIFIAVLRLPVVRLAYGDVHFDWQDTLQTGYVVSAFTIGIFAYSLSLLASRAFYALQDTGTPVKISIFTIFLNAILGLSFLSILHLPIWSLPLAYSIAGIFQIIALMTLLTRKVGGFAEHNLATTFGKIILASGSSGIIMFVLLKLLDRTAVDKKLAFLGKIGIGLPTTFDKFLLDTRYTANLIVLTFVVGALGLAIYLLLCYLLKVEELRVVVRAIKLVKDARFRLPLFTRTISKPEEPLNTPPANNL